jgi:uncharacterized protein YggE
MNPNSTSSCMGCLNTKSVQIGVATVAGLLSLFLLAKTVSEFKQMNYIGSGIPAQNTLSVQGKAEVTIKPDIANFSFSVSEEAAGPGLAQENASKKFNAIYETLKANGVAEKDVQVSGYSIYPRYEYPAATMYGQTGKRVLAAYVVTQTAEVKVRKIEDAGKLLSLVGTKGASDISGLAFDVDKREEMVKSMRAQAIADAKKNAESLARDLGVSIVRIVSFSEGGYTPSYYDGKAMSTMARGGIMEAAVAPQIPTGETKLTSNVSIVYEVR